MSQLTEDDEHQTDLSWNESGPVYSTNKPHFESFMGIKNPSFEDMKKECAPEIPGPFLRCEKGDYDKCESESRWYNSQQKYFQGPVQKNGKQKLFTAENYPNLLPLGDKELDNVRNPVAPKLTHFYTLADQTEQHFRRLAEKDGNVVAQRVVKELEKTTKEKHTPQNNLYVVGFFAKTVWTNEAQHRAEWSIPYPNVDNNMAPQVLSIERVQFVSVDKVQTMDNRWCNDGNEGVDLTTPQWLEDARTEKPEGKMFLAPYKFRGTDVHANQLNQHKNPTDVRILDTMHPLFGRMQHREFGKHVHNRDYQWANYRYGTKVLTNGDGACLYHAFGNQLSTHFKIEIVEINQEQGVGFRSRLRLYGKLYPAPPDNWENQGIRVTTTTGGTCQYAHQLRDMIAWCSDDMFRMLNELTGWRADADVDGVALPVMPRQAFNSARDRARTHAWGQTHELMILCIMFNVCTVMYREGRDRDMNTADNIRGYYQTLYKDIGGNLFADTGDTPVTRESMNTTLGGVWGLYNPQHINEVPVTREYEQTGIDSKTTMDRRWPMASACGERTVYVYNENNGHFSSLLVTDDDRPPNDATDDDYVRMVTVAQENFLLEQGITGIGEVLKNYDDVDAPPPAKKQKTDPNPFANSNIFHYGDMGFGP